MNSAPSSSPSISAFQLETTRDSCHLIEDAALQELIEPVGDLDVLDQACFRKSDDLWRQVREESWDHIYERTLIYMRTNLGYFFDYNIAEGTFGRFVRMYEPEARAEVTVWFTDEANIRKEDLWRVLSHPNLMELVRRIRVDVCTPFLQTCIAYVMPAFDFTLQQKVTPKVFRYSETAYGQIKAWLYEIMNALDYLHSRGMYHLNIHMRNVFIIRGNRAALGGLANLHRAGTVTADAVKVDTIYAPPEVVAARIGMDNKMWELQADRIDMWSLCAMFAEALTCHWRWKIRKFLVLTKNRVHSTGDRLALLGDYTTSRFQSPECLRRYLNRSFRSIMFEDEEVGSLALLLQCGLKVVPGERKVVSGMLRARYWTDTFTSPRSPPVEENLECSSQENTTNYSWDDEQQYSSRELLHFYRNLSEDDDDEETDDELRRGDTSEDTLTPEGASPTQTTMVLLPRADVLRISTLENSPTISSTLTGETGRQRSKSFASKTREWFGEMRRRCSIRK
ncbi:uncharacterized protein LOC135384056 [Ornithodoros turicata]|uniref:uncharacterized protein LOC135384056 n=1 Tax=Ornithodoros turicata TaxID=34597 RepID=UPI003138C694